mmetsp:Transcript_2555/g.16726  ORF Transcript_2555/g.16726 Transcript_2555/m.16726 type:complete len:327 (+) Transcript_2555:478-1458(+)
MAQKRSSQTGCLDSRRKDGECRSTPHPPERRGLQLGKRQGSATCASWIKQNAHCTKGKIRYHAGSEKTSSPREHCTEVPPAQSAHCWPKRSQRCSTRNIIQQLFTKPLGCCKSFALASAFLALDLVGTDTFLPSSKRFHHFLLRHLSHTFRHPVATVLHHLCQALHTRSHGTKLLQQIAHLNLRSPATFGNSASPRGGRRQNLRLGSLFWGHGVDHRFKYLQHTFCIFESFVTYFAHTRKHLHQLSHVSHVCHHLRLLQEIIEVKLGLHDPLLHSFCFSSIDRFLGFLHQCQHISHTKDAAHQPLWIEGLKGIQFFSQTHKLDWLA